MSPLPVRTNGLFAVLCTLLCLVSLTATPSAFAGKPLKVTASPQASTTGLAVTVKVSEGGAVSARLQRKVGRRWTTVASGKLKARSVTLRWAGGTPGTAYRLRAQALRGKRVLGTSQSLVARAPVPNPSRPPLSTSGPLPTSSTPPATTGPPAPAPTPEPEPVPEIAEQRLSLGGTTKCRIDAGEVRCWGDGIRGQLGDGARDWRAYAAGVPGMTDARSVAVGSAHACAARRDGTVWCWGDNFRAQLGGATAAQLSAVPVRIPGVTRVLSLVSGPGAEFTCVNRLDRAPLCWGTVPTALLGPDLPTVLDKPTAVPSLEGTTIVSASSSRLCVRWTTRPTETTSTKCLAPSPAEWGRTDAGEMHGASAAVRELSAGAGGSCALLTGDEIRCEASAGYEYADPAGGLDNWATPRVLTLSIPGASDVAAGSHTACAARGASAVRCWGAAPFVVATPFDVPGTAGVVSLESDGADGYCGADAAGVVRCWGQGMAPGTLGWSVSAPLPLELDGDLTAPGVSDDLGCGVRAGGVECWGRTPALTSPAATTPGARRRSLGPPASCRSWRSAKVRAGAGPTAKCCAGDSFRAT